MVRRRTCLCKHGGWGSADGQAAGMAQAVPQAVQRRDMPLEQLVQAGGVASAARILGRSSWRGQPRRAAMEAGRSAPTSGQAAERMGLLRSQA